MYTRSLRPYNRFFFFFYKSKFDPNVHNSNGLCIEFEQRSKCDVILARPMSSTRRFFLLRPRLSIYAMNLDV